MRKLVRELNDFFILLNIEAHSEPIDPVVEPDAQSET